MLYIIKKIYKGETWLEKSVEEGVVVYIIENNNDG